METKFRSHGNSTNAKLTASGQFRYRFRARSSLVACIHETAFTFGKRPYSRLYFLHISNLSLLNKSKRLAWAIRSGADGGELNPSPKNNSSRGTRLIRAVQAIRLKLGARIKEIRKNFPMKLLSLLVGFYCATVFATVIGQTGDWDILSAALSVAVVEGIGALTYRASLPLFSKVRSLITMFNYWKAGLSLGLFLDSFKYEMEHAIGLSNPFCFEIDIFPVFW